MPLPMRTTASAAAALGAAIVATTAMLAEVTVSVMSLGVMPLPQSVASLSLKAAWSKASMVPAMVKEHVRLVDCAGGGDGGG